MGEDVEEAGIGGFIDTEYEGGLDVIRFNGSAYSSEELVFVDGRVGVVAEFKRVLLGRPVLLKVEFGERFEHVFKIGPGVTLPVGSDFLLPGGDGLPGGLWADFKNTGADVTDSVGGQRQVEVSNSLLDEFLVTAGYIKEGNVGLLGQATEEGADLMRLGLLAIGQESAIEVGGEEEGLHGVRGVVGQEGRGGR